MIAPRHQIARLQSDFYRDQFHRMLRWLIISLVIIFLLIAGIVYTILFQPKIPYYANTIDGRIMDMPAPTQKAK